MKLEYSRQVFEKHPNIKFHESPSSGSRVVQCGRTDRHMTELILAFRNFANAPKNVRHCVRQFAMQLDYTCGVGGTARLSGYSFSCTHLAEETCRNGRSSADSDSERSHTAI